MSLEARYADGQFAALVRLKLAFPAATHPVVQQSATLQSKPGAQISQQAQQKLEPPTTPFDVSQLFSVHEQAHTRSEPMRKLSAAMCTSCRKDKHYGTCAKPIPIKRADFNIGMTGDDPKMGDNPSTSPHYHSATTSDSALARARDGRPAGEQARTYFSDLYRANGGGLNGMADQAVQSTGGLSKVSRLRAPKIGGWQLWGTDGHSTHEQRGPSVNPYEERPTVKSPPVGWGDEGAQRIRRAFDQVDGAAEPTSIGGGFGEPSGGPAVLG